MALAWCTRGTGVRAAIALLVGIAFPNLEVAWNCRAGEAFSEACVWGRAYLPLMRWVEPVIVAPIVFLILTLWAWWRRRARRRATFR